MVNRKWRIEGVRFASLYLRFTIYCFLLFTLYHLPLLKLVMRKRLVSVRHAMRVFLLLHRIAAIVCCVENLTGEPINHRLFAASARIRHNPTDCQGAAPFLVDLDWHLIS